MTSGTPTVADSVNGANYTYKGPTLVTGVTNLGTWEYVTPKGALPGTFTITFTIRPVPCLSRDDDRRIQLRHRGHLLDRQQRYTTPKQRQARCPWPSALIGLRHRPGLRRRDSSTGAELASPGSGFTLAYNAQIILGQSYGIASEYLLNETSSINPTMSCSGAALVSINGIAFKAIAPHSAMLLTG